MSDRAPLEKRLERLYLLRGPVEKAVAAFEGQADAKVRQDRLLIRDGFAYLSVPAPGGGSDRRVPERRLRPPATRIATSRGAALRLELTALALAQNQRRRGRFVNVLPLRPNTAEDHPVGWIDLLASTAQYRGSGRDLATANDKKLRHLHKALGSLSAAELVSLPNEGSARGVYEGFQLLDERGARAEGEPLPYQPPGAGDRVFGLPLKFITNGWVHVLEDSEISLLLMAACGRGGLPGERLVAVPAEVRLLQYGISRDAFAAHQLLSHLGLLYVEEVARYDSGRAEAFSEDGPRLHRLRVVDEGFEQDGLETVIKTIEHRLKKSPASGAPVRRP